MKTVKKMFKLTPSAKSFYALATIFLVVIGAYALKPVLTLVLLAFVCSVILTKPVKFLESKGWSRSLASAAIVVAAMGAVILSLSAASIQLFELTASDSGLATKIGACLEKYAVALQHKFPALKNGPLTDYKQSSEKAFEKISSMAITSIPSTLSWIGQALLVPMFVFFFLLYESFLRKFFHKAIDADNSEIDDVLSKVYLVIEDYFSGLALVMAIVAALNFIGLLLLGVPSALFFATLASLLMIIPYVGVIVGSLLPVALTLVTKDDPMLALAVGGWMWGVQLLEGNFITPNIVGSKVSVNPLFAMLSFMLFGLLWGTFGLVLAMPLIAILKVIFDASPSTQPYGMLIGEVPNLPKTASEKAKSPKTDFESAPKPSGLFSK